MRIKYSLCFVFFTLLMTAAAMNASSQGVPDLFTVNSITDSHDAVPGDHICADAQNKCTLRAAIEEANAASNPPDVIVFALPNPSVIDLTLGELAISANVSIVGPGARRLTVERSRVANTPEFRVFNIYNGLLGVNLRGLKISNGLLTPVDGSIGAGVLIQIESTVNLTDLWVTGNKARGGGGVWNSGNLNMRRCLLQTNGANVGGSALDNDTAAFATVTNSTFTGNGSNNDGAIQNDAGATLLLANDTFFGNENGGLTGTAVCNHGTASVLNTLFADPFSGSSFPLFGTFNSLGNNVVVWPAHSLGFVDGVNGDQVGNVGDPLIGSLANNGGQTDTFSLLNGSPAIDHGNPCIRLGNCSGFSGILIRDQRDFAFRPADTPDVGAYETSALSGTGTGSLTTSVGFGGVEAKSLSSIGVLTDPVTNQKYYTVSNAQGYFYFKNVPTDVFVFEVKSKHQGFSTGPIPLFFDDFSIGSRPSQPIQFGQGLTLTVTATPVRK